jgi:NADPH:quinone reductase-like Zn-dependent oxidoreductase
LRELLVVVDSNAQTAVFPDALPERRAGIADKEAVIVTGASRGIGAAVVQAFLHRGHKASA